MSGCLYSPETDTLSHARSVLDRDGRLVVSVPETVKASADEVAPALAAT